jgi:hypothetical protein
VLRVANISLATLESLLSRYELQLQLQSDGEIITGSYWGDSEAGVVGRTVFVRTDTPIHSLLHEMSHIICMTAERRQHLQTDAGGDDLEEAAVCYLQIILSDEIEGAGRGRLFRDMDAWGYSFRLGDTSSWFERDAEDACKWLIDCNLLTADGRPSFQLRG